MSTTITSPPTAPAPPPRKRGGGIVVLIVLAGLVLAGGTWTLLSFIGVSADTDTSGYEGIAEIVIDAEAGDIAIAASGSDDEVTVTATRESSFLRTPRDDRDVRGDTLHLTEDCPGWLRINCSVDYDLQVPRGTTVRLATAAGDVSIDGVDGAVDASTVAGDVVLSGVGSDRLDITTVAGNVEVDTTSRPDEISAQTTAGDVDLRVPDGGYRVDTDTTTGDVSVQVRHDPEATRTITAGTVAGNIRIDPR